MEKVYRTAIIVDITSDSGYAMRIRTTATDKFQTQRIADMIRKWINWDCLCIVVS